MQARATQLTKHTHGEHLLHLRAHGQLTHVGVLGEQGRREPAHPEPRCGVGGRRHPRQLRVAGGHPDGARQ